MKKTIIISLVALLLPLWGLGDFIWAQGTSGMFPPAIDVNNASITKVGHATVTARKKIVIDSLTAKVDTVCVIDTIEWNTATGTASKRIAAQRRRKAPATGSDYYDNDTNWWWDMWWFSYNYPSVNGKGEPITLSSLTCMPDEDCSKVNNVVIACHSTITANRECPTMNNSNDLLDTNDTDFFMLHASSGWTVHAKQSDMPYYNLVIIPDYEGYGLTKNVPHPYLSEELTARQVVDGVRYGIALYKTSDKVKKVRHPFRDGWRSFSVGYSQGGGTSMAVHRFIEQNNLVNELQFTGSICGAGPYNPMTTIMYYIGQAQRGDKMAMAVVLPLILKGMCDSNPYMRNHQVSDYMVQRFLDTGILNWLTSKNYSTSDIKDEWDSCRKNGYGDVVESGGEAYLTRIMKAEGYEYFSSLGDCSAQLPNGLWFDVSNVPGLDNLTGFFDDYCFAADPARPTKRGVMEDLHLALAYNDLTKGWNPEHPLYLYHSYYDDVVPLANRVSAKYMFGDWVTRLNPSINLGHVATAIEFLAGTEEYDAVRKLAKASIHPAAQNLGKAELVYKGTVQVDEENVVAEYLVKYDDTAQRSYAVLGSGYNTCISQYLKGKVVVPAEVTLNGTTYPVEGINDMAFRMCLGITHVTLPEGVKRIGDFAFFACKGLLEADLPSTLQTIGSGAFIDLPNLQSVICRATTPPTWEYNDVFCFHEDGIGDANTYTTNDIMLWVADDTENSYKTANFTDEELGWTTPDGWGYFGNNIRSISDKISEAYAVYADSTLTFHYDGRKASRSGRVFELNGSNPDVPDQFPGWTDNTNESAPTHSDDPEDHSKEIKRVVFSPSFYFARPVTTAKWFTGCENLETIEGWENLNTSEVVTMAFMFSDCKSLRDDDLDFSNFYTPKCENFIYMFKGCTGLTTLDLSHFDTSSANSLTSMFEDCTNLISINLNSFDTRNVEYFSGMFYNCSSLESLEMEKLYIGTNARVDGFFSHCSSLQTLTLPFEIKTVENMFGGLTNMKDLYYYGVKPFNGWAHRDTDFMPDQRTRLHVTPSSLEDWQEKWPNDPIIDPNFYANVTYVPDLFTDECPMQIYTAAQWELLGDLVEAGTTDIHAKLMADIEVTTMVGSTTHPFNGYFDGMGHTITCNLNGGSFTAPFSAIGGATIKDLHVSGTITGKRHTAGIAGICVNGKGDNTITNCIVDASLTCNSIVGGIIGHGQSSRNTIAGCLFAGKMTLDMANQDMYPFAAAIMGWCDDPSTQTVEDCLGLGTIIYYGRTAMNLYVDGAFKGTNSYFCTTSDEEDIVFGVQIKSLNDELKPRCNGTATAYDVSGLTAYPSCLVLNGTIFGALGETVPVTFDVPNGYTLSSVNRCSYELGNLIIGDALSQDADGNYLVDLSEGGISQPAYIMPNLELGTLLLKSDDDNSEDLITVDGKTLNVQLAGRTLYRDGDWNTLSLPFSLTEEQIAESPLAGCTLTTLSEVAFSNGTLTLTFTDTTAISADKSYLIKWTNTGDDITNPVFSDVTISRTIPAGIKFWLVEEKKAIGFKGTYDRIDFGGEDKSVLFLGTNNKLYYPDGTASTYIGACRAYFDMYGMTAAELKRNARNYVLQFNNATSVKDITSATSSDEQWYDLSGRRISKSPASSVLPRGVYINNGKKVVIK